MVLPFLIAAVLFGTAASYGHNCPLMSGSSSVQEGARYLQEPAQHPFGGFNDIHFDDDLLDATGNKIEPPHLDIQPLIVSGPYDNRVNLVFFSDGYLDEEKDKFIEDAMRLAKDVSGNQTFNTVQPLLNFWAAFTASAESGIGKGGVPKDTTYGLYRPGTELRGVYYAKPKVAGAACKSMGKQCDYPILLGNDPLYGGLGGKYTVITSSLANGPLILRHELGHSIIPVGEEYDGGFAYFGVDAFTNLSEPVPWAHWLSDASTAQSKRVERSIMPMQNYPWAMLDTSNSWSTSFNSSGLYSRYLVRCSISGIPDANDLRVEFDGKDLGWAPRKDIGLDRWHYDFYSEDGAGLSEGAHTLTFTLLNGERVGTAQMCSAEILEFGDENEFIKTPGYYGIFPTFSESNETSYRPTNEDCLMRQVTTPSFCKVCIEGLWYSLLSRVHLIDSVTSTCNTDGTRSLDSAIVPLAHLRPNAIEGLEESLSIVWSKDGVALDAYANLTSISVDGELTGSYNVAIRYATEEIRLKREELLTANMSLSVPHAC